jgi:predicted nucleotidyltransferase
MAKNRESALRYPLTRILGSVANVKTLRELERHGGELSAPSLCVRTRLSTRAVQLSLRALEEMNVIRSLGSGRSRLYRRRRSHPLSQVLLELFREEESRFEAIVGRVREAAEAHRPPLTAAWLYGSVARKEDRPTSDLDIAAVTATDDAPNAQHRLQEALHDAEKELAFRVSLITLSANDVVQLAAQNDPLWVDLRADSMTIFGDPPETLLQRMTRGNGRPPRT